MWKCPKCQKTIQGNICPDCGISSSEGIWEKSAGGISKKELKEQKKKAKIQAKIEKLEAKHKKKAAELKTKYVNTGVDDEQLPENYKLKTKIKRLRIVCVLMAGVVVLSTVGFARYSLWRKEVYKSSNKYIEACKEELKKAKKYEYSESEKRAMKNVYQNKISAGESYTLALKIDGTMLEKGYVCDGKSRRNQEIPSGNIVSISAGKKHFVCLKSDGTVSVVGDLSLDNYYDYGDEKDWYKHGNEIIMHKGAISAVAGWNHVVWIMEDGRVYALGSNDYGQCNVNTWRNIFKITAGGYHTVGLKKDGTLVVAGDNEYGQCNIGDWKSIIEVSAGGLHTAGIKSNGTVVATGYNKYGQCNVGDWENIVSISAGYNHTIGLKSDGTVVATGNNAAGQCDVENWENIVAVSAGEFHTVGLKSDGTVVATGINDCGQCNVEKWNLFITDDDSDYKKRGESNVEIS